MLSEILALLVAAGCICAGALAGRRQGFFHACWLAGTTLVALRLGGVTWAACVQQIRTERLLSDAASIPAGFLAVFGAALVAGVVVQRIVAQLGHPPLLHPPIERWGPEIVGGVAGAFAFLGLAQAVLFTPVIAERAPGTLAFARGMLVALGQELPRL